MEKIACILSSLPNEPFILPSQSKGILQKSKDRVNFECLIKNFAKNIVQLMSCLVVGGGATAVEWALKSIAAGVMLMGNYLARKFGIYKESTKPAARHLKN